MKKAVIVLSFLLVLIIVTSIYIIKAQEALYLTKEVDLISEKVSLWSEIDHLEAMVNYQAKLISEGQEIAGGFKLVPLGEFEVTHYAYTGSLTKSETMTRANRTVAVDPKVIPLGSLIYVENYGLKIAVAPDNIALNAEDTGGAIKGNVIDVYLPNEKQCLERGRLENMKVWIVESVD